MSESLSFLLVRYALVALVGCIALSSWRARRHAVAVCLVLLGSLGVVQWIGIWAPLQSPYGVQPGSESSFELAVVTAAAAHGHPLESWVVGRRNPRPAWSALWSAGASGRPELARKLYPFIAPLTLLVLPFAIFWLVATRPGDEWEILSCVFAGAYGSSVLLDAFQPFEFFSQQFFLVSPHRALALVLALVAMGLAWRGTKPQVLAAGAALALLGWLDLTVFFWCATSLLVLELLRIVRGKTLENVGAWRAALVGIVLSSPQWLALLGDELLVRIPSSGEVVALRTVFADVFAVTADMGWIFVLAAIAVPTLWRRAERTDLGILSMMTSAYLVWIVLALAFQWRPFSEPDVALHLLRFSVAIAAGVGGFQCARWLVERQRFVELRASPAAFLLVVLFLLPATALFWWRPFQTDAAYYPSLRRFDPSVERLERWVLDNTDVDEIVVTGDETGEWIAALTGRRVLSAPNTLPRDRARELRVQVRRLMTSNDADVMRDASDALGGSVLVWDKSLEETYWEFDKTLLESTGLYRKVHQIGDVYGIYQKR